MKDSWVIGLVSVVAVLLMCSLAWVFRDRVWTGHNDFVQLYSGARLAGTPHLYDRDRVRRVQQELVGATGESWRYTRLPYYAAVLWPLGRLPYRTAYVVWELLAVVAFVGFVWLWRPTSFPITLLFSCLSLPVFVALMNGQDLTFVLLWIAGAVYCHRRGSAFAAGLLFSLCAAKFHLFVLAPLLMLGRRNRRFGWGLLSGGAALAALSFAVAGASWLREHYLVLADPVIHPSVAHMPNLHGLFAAWPASGPLEWIAMAAVAGITALIAGRMDFEYALAATLAGGLLVSYHAYLADCSLLLPAGLVVLATTSYSWLRLVAVLLLTPASGFLLLMDSSLAATVPLAVLLLVMLMGLEAWRRPRPA